MVGWRPCLDEERVRGERWDGARLREGIVKEYGGVAWLRMVGCLVNNGKKKILYTYVPAVITQTRLQVVSIKIKINRV